MARIDHKSKRKPSHVYLDGRLLPLKPIIALDPDEGWVERYVMKPGQTVVKLDMHGRVQTERLTGAVRVVFAETLEK